MPFEVEATLLALFAAVRGLELGADGTIEGGIPHLVSNAEKVVLGVAVGPALSRHRLTPNMQDRFSHGEHPPDGQNGASSIAFG